MSIRSALRAFGLVPRSQVDAAAAAVEAAIGSAGGGLYDPLGAAASGDAAHAAAGDPHPVYLTAAEGNAAYDAIGTAAAGDAAHVAAGDPHAQYLTAAEGNAAYDAIGAAASGDAAHVGAADPHTAYQRESEKGGPGGYAGLDAESQVPTAQLATGVADTTTYLRGDQTWAVVPPGGMSAVPLTIAPGDDYTIAANTQVLYHRPIQVNGDLISDGDLISV